MSRMQTEYKTPEYVRNAAKKYRSEHDQILVILPKGTKEQLAAADIRPAEIRELIINHIDQKLKKVKRETEKKIAEEVEKQELGFDAFM